MRDKTQYEVVPWLSTLATDGITPSICDKALEEDVCSHGRDRLWKWKKEGLPKWVADRLAASLRYSREHPETYPDEQAELTRDLRHAARTSGHMAFLGRPYGGRRHRSKQFDNGVELRDNLRGKTCQCCGKETQRGELVVAGFRRRGTMSNRTGYIHVSCLGQHKINGEKIFRRELHLNSYGTRQVKKCGCRLSDHPTCSTAKGMPPTHVMWVGMADAQESVPFNIEALNRRRNLSGDKSVIIE